MGILDTIGDVVWPGRPEFLGGDEGNDWRDALGSTPISPTRYIYSAIELANAIERRTGSDWSLHPKSKQQSKRISDYEVGDKPPTPEAEQEMYDSISNLFEAANSRIDQGRRQLRGERRDRRESQAMAELEALIASLPKPVLADVSAGYEAARQSANESYDSALPVIGEQQRALLGALARYAGEGRREGREASRQTAQEGRTAVSEAAALSRSIAADLSRQSGSDAVSGLVTGAEGDARAQEQAIRSSFSDEQQLQRDLGRNEQSSIRDQRGAARQVTAAANADARNNLSAILGQIGIQQADAESQAQAQYQQELQDYATRVAEMRYGGLQDFRANEQARTQQRQENQFALAQQGQEAALQARQATGEAANDVIQQLDAAVQAGQDPTAAFELIANTYGPSWESGDNPAGIPLDTAKIVEAAQRYIESLGLREEQAG